jgi:hypothetical protein
MEDSYSNPMATVPPPSINPNMNAQQSMSIIITDNGGFYIRGTERHDGKTVSKQYVATDVEQAMGYIRAMLEYMITN